MVIFNRSLRAVFRKESWMFCAGLLLSIADLLKFFDLQSPTCPFPQAPGRAQTNSMFLRPSASGARGVRCRTNFSCKLRRSAGSCEEHTASLFSFQHRL